MSTPQAVRGTVVTMNPARAVLADGVVVMDGSEIVAVGPAEQIAAAWPDLPLGNRTTDLIVPGYVNGHQHLTGDRLIQSSIPDDLPPGQSISQWVLPVHAAHTADDDLLAATLSLAEGACNGITTTVEAGTVAHPAKVAEAARSLGVRITLGTWGWDVEDGPFSGPVAEVIDRQRSVLEADHGPLVRPWVTLVGHDLMSDELVIEAGRLATTNDTGLTFHLSPSTADPRSYLARTGRRPVAHLHHLGILGPHVAIAHAVHVDEDEVGLLVDSRVAVVACPWAYLRLGQGTTRAFRHLELWRRGGRIALGCDAENAGDAVDGLRTAALFAGLAKDVAMDPTGFGAHDAFELLTIRGAEALGMDDEIGSLETGKQADLVVHDRSGPSWAPVADDAVQQLVWGSDGRSVRDVFVAGHQVVRDGLPTGIDLPALAAEAQRASTALLRRSEVAPRARWPAR